MRYVIYVMVSCSILLLSILLVRQLLFVWYVITKKIKRLKKKRIYKNIGLTVGCIVCLTIITCSLVRNNGLLHHLTPENQGEMTQSSESISMEYKKAVAKIEFKPDIINKKDTVWERLMNECLHYENYELWKGHNLVDKDLWVNYMRSICERNTGSVALDELKEYFFMFYGTSLLPESNRSIAQVSAEIPPLEERQNTRPELFIEEFGLRMQDCSESSSAECFYQAGRAADDAFKQLISNNMATQKQKMLFSAMAVSLYQLSLDRNDGNLSVSETFIKYRIGEIYIFMYENGEYYLEKESYNVHFLLSAQAHLLRAEEAFGADHENDDIHLEQPYHNYYMAYVQYTLATVYGYDDPDMIEDCQTYALSYINSPYGRDTCVKSCQDFIIKLDKLK